MCVCMCVCMYVCIYVCMYVCTCVRTYLCMYVYMYMCMSLYVYVCMSFCLSFCLSVCLCVGWHCYIPCAYVSGYVCEVGARTSTCTGMSARAHIYVLVAIGLKVLFSFHLLVTVLSELPDTNHQAFSRYLYQTWQRSRASLLRRFQ